MLNEELSNIEKKLDSSKVKVSGKRRKTYVEYNILTATQSAFSKYMDFSGRATLSEYLWFLCAYILLNVVLFFVIIWWEVFIGLAFRINLIFIIPILSVTVRRLHDVGKSGWNILWALVHVLIVFYYTLKEGDKGSNKYGPSEMDSE